MAHTSSLVFAGIAPHPPIMVPEVGREAAGEVRASIDAMAEMTERVISAGAQTVVIISPHAPLDARAFVAYDGPELYGDFANFRAPEATIHFEMDEELLGEISAAAGAEGLVTSRIKGYELDHGTAVPLYFLQRNGWHGHVVALGYTFLSNEDHLRFGTSIKSAIDKSGRPAAFIASGDLSHRLKPDAPAGFNPDAHLFDEEVVDAIRNCSPNRIVKIDQDLRRTAGECGYRSMLVALGVAEGSMPACEVISYEAPFGVGYMVAQLVRYTGVSPAGHGLRDEVGTESGPGSPRGQPAWGGGSDRVIPGTGPTLRERSSEPPAVAGGPSSSLPALARLTIETFITAGTIISPPGPLSDLLRARAGCFVSIKTRNGDLRGCIGTIEPVKDTLAEELVTNAISAATRDPRFPAVRPDELPRLRYSVDVLSAPEPCTMNDLDPKTYGVIVEDESGLRRGLLLPNLEGIDTAARQVEIASRKAGIGRDTPVNLFRFRAVRYSE